MLEDRDYMRQANYGGMAVSFTVALIIINTVIFIAEATVFNTPRAAAFIDDYFALSLQGLQHGYAWQLLTFQFLHGGWMHLLVNMLAFFSLGRPVEMALGSSRFLALYLSSGIIGGLCQMGAAFAWPAYFGGAVVGASAGVYGVVTAFAVINWSERFTLLLFYFIPVEMSGRMLFWFTIASAAALFFVVGYNIANVAHLGGILTGALFVRQIVQGRWHWPNLSLPSLRRSPRREFVVTRANGKFWRSGGKSDDGLSADEFLKSEVDPILDKISAHGIQSLTASEREILEKARDKMGKR